MKLARHPKLWTSTVSFLALVALVGLGTLLAQKNDEPKAFTLPIEVGKSVVVDIPGLPSQAKKLEFVLIPGLGKVRPFLLGKYELTQGQYESRDAHQSQHLQKRS